MNGKIEQGLHEKLCAYVLGESEGAERAEVERELLRSPELRAERERLEGTIGAVRDAMQPAHTLTPAAKAALERAVRPAPIAQFPWLRLAAGIGAVGLGWWIFAQAPTRQADVIVEVIDTETKSEEEAEIDLAVAMLESQLPPSASALRRDQLHELVEQYEGDAAAKVDQATRRAGKLESLGYAGGGIELGKSLAPSAPASAAGSEIVQLEKEAPAVDAKKGADAVSTGLVAVVPVEAKAAAPVEIAQADSVSRTTDSSGLNRAVEVGSTSIGHGAPDANPAPMGGRKLGGGPRKGRAGGPTVARVQPALAAPAVAKDALPPPSSYRGSGDPIAERDGGTLAKSTGPSTLGPSGTSTGGPAGPSAGTGVRLSATKATSSELAKLGYAAGDDEDDARRRQAQREWDYLPPAEQARRLELRYGSIIEGCFPRPNERPRDMFFRFWGDNPFEVTLLDKQSTFSADVDTASYALARRYLNEGKVPEKAQVRTEEFVNYFASDVEAPRNATFSVHSDLTPSRFSADSARQMLRVVVRAKDVDKSERQPMHLTFVVDVSGSMKENDRLETVKHALRMLVAQLDGRDSIALVTFSDDARIVLPMTPVVDRAAIEAVIAPLVPLNSTNSNAGLQLGYAQALEGLDPNAVNRVVFLSDGVANVGETDATKIIEGVQSIRAKGIFLNTIGVGMNNHNDVLLEQLADKGDGLCNYVDSPKEIQRALVDRFTGAFQPIAKDVKIQVEFDPRQVMRYRLLGYENRAIADADFRNDAVDAGELGAGHQVTALYEIEPTGRAGDSPMATVRLRWKPIRAAGASGVQEATEASFDVSSKSYQAFETSPPGHRRALIVGQFAEILRRSTHARGESFDDLIQEASRLQAQTPNDEDFAEFTTLLLRAKDSVLRTMPACDELCQTIDAYRSNTYLGAVFHETGRDAQSLAEIEKARLELEQRLREVLRRQAEGSTQKLDDLGDTRGKVK